MCTQQISFHGATFFYIKEKSQIRVIFCSFTSKFLPTNAFNAFLGHVFKQIHASIIFSTFSQFTDACEGHPDSEQVDRATWVIRPTP